MIHVHHDEHIDGVRVFFRRRDADVGAAIHSHLRTEIDATLTRVELEDTVGLGLMAADVLPRGLRVDRETTEVLPTRWFVR